MKSAGAGDDEAPEMPEPEGGAVPYGQTSPFNPQYSSVLPDNPSRTAMLADPARMEGGPTVPLQEQQAAETSGRDSLALLMEKLKGKQAPAPLEPLKYGPSMQKGYEHGPWR